MNPFYFGTAERRLFGIYEAARRLPVRGAVVLCHPWGSEYIHAHRSMRQLSKTLMIAGFHTLRFDYSGTGDSAGEMTAASLHDWETDIQLAVDELRETTNAASIVLIGLRLGATLAAHVAAAAVTPTKSLVLWDPVLCGENYVNELLRGYQAGWGEREMPRGRPASFGGGHEIRGFPLTERMALELRTVDLAALAPALPARTLVVISQATQCQAGLSALELRDQSSSAVEFIESQPAWIEWPLGHPRAGTVPVGIIQRIVEWLS
jgi:pimeloyl-ACP methyl ester carboxylesterase